MVTEPPECFNHQWKYRIEGSQKMVFSSHNNNDDDRAHVLCIFSNSKPLPRFATQSLFKKYLSRYLMPASTHHVPPTFVNELIARAQPHRPLDRPQVFKAHGIGAIYPDAAFHFGMKTTLVEIKAKCGVLSKSRLTPPWIATALRPFSIPPYHIKNYLVAHGCLPDKPYNPADLLSDDAARLRHAVTVLMAENSRALRVFKNGKIVESNSDCETVFAAAAALVHDGSACTGIKAIQEHDLLGKFGALNAMNILTRREGRSITEQLIISELHKSVKEAGLKEVSKQRSKLCYETPEEGIRLHSEENYETALQSINRMDTQTLAALLAHCLQAATAKDCSLLIAMCRAVEFCGSDQDRDLVVCVDGVDWMYRIWVIDVDEKDMGKITGKWIDDEQRYAAKLTARNVDY